MSGNVDRRGRNFWDPSWPERGQYIRLWPTRLEIPEWAAFGIVVAVCVALLIVSVVAF